MNPTRRWALGIWLLLLALYADSLDNGFHYDDFHSIVNNPHIRTLDNLPDFFTDPAFFSVDPKQGMYRPLLLVTYALNYRFGGNDPFGYHLVNLLLHGLNATLVLLLVRRLTGRVQLAGLAALLFAVNPLNAEAVNYVSSRSELLMSALFLLACLGHLRSGETGRWGWYLSGLICGGAALLVKSVAVTLTGGLLLCDWLAGGVERVRTQRRRYLPFAGLALAYVLFSRGRIGKALGEPVRSLSVQLWTQVKGLVYYLKLESMPVGLSVEHQFAVSRSPGEGAVVAAGLLGLSLLLLLVQSRKRLFHFAGGWFGLLLGPTLAVPLIVLVNEHRLYLAGIGASLLVAFCGVAFGKRFGGVAWGMVGVYTISLAGVTLQRNRVWEEELTLWADAAARGPMMLKPHLRLADALAEKGRLEEAEAAYRRALELRPKHPATRNNLGTLYMRAGRLEEAEAEFRSLLESDPEMIPTRLNLARLLLREGRWQEAETEYLKGLEFDDTGGVAQRNLGNIALRFRREPTRALKYFEEALALNPGEKETLWSGCGVALRMLGRLEEAERAYGKALEIAPDYADAWFNLGNLLRDSGRLEEAVRAYEKVVKLGEEPVLVDLARENIQSLKP